MKFTRFAWFLAAASLLFTVSAPKAAMAIDLIVEHTLSDPSHFTTIQAAINQAAINLVAHPTNSYRIRVTADQTAYTGPITPISNVSIVGDSTSGTFIDGGGASPISLSGVSNVTIRNFTIRNSSVGIAVNNSSGISITNTVFQSLTGTAIQVQGSTSTSIINNTFFNNAVAISPDASTLITNDIFSTNRIAIATQSAQLSYSDFFGNPNNIGSQPNSLTNIGSNAIPNINQANPDPLFVSSTIPDFHLQAGSPCKGSGNINYTNSFNNTIDMGAYGGPNSDIPTPSAITGISSSLTPPSTIGLTWDAATDNSVTAYRVYYGTASRTYTAPGSPLTVTTNSATLTDLPFANLAIPAAPATLKLTPQNGALQLDWSAVTGATGYQVLYSTTLGGNSQPATPTTLTVGVVTSATITGLANGTTYYAAVKALAQPQYFLAITAVINSAIGSNPGSVNESSYSTEIVQGVGTLQTGAPSPVQHDSPETVSPFPNLKGEGCFIATAAYGFYSAPQVQVLRDFRDRYLLTCAPGRAFVAWYYHYGPYGAHFINLHPWLKPPVRLLLLPLVVGCYLLVHTPPTAKLAILIFALIGALLRVRRTQRKMPVCSGGTH